MQLWRHGATRILVNHEHPTALGPRVAAIAVESADPIRSAQRAERLLAPVLPRARGPDEADLSAIAAPDGTSVFFCRTDAADADSWVADFLTAGPLPADAGSELTGIDHVALSQPFDYFDEAALFYRSVLRLERARADRAHARPRHLYEAGEGGELLHFYTAMAGPSLFFEVLQRRAGHDGYGASNSPVRICIPAGP